MRKEDLPTPCDHLPASKADVYNVVNLIAALAEKLTGEKFIFALAHHPLPELVKPIPEAVIWFKPSDHWGAAEAPASEPGQPEATAPSP